MEDQSKSKSQLIAELEELREKIRVMESPRLAYHKVAEKFIDEDEDKFRAVFDSFEDVYYQINRENIITVISPSIRQYGYSFDDLVGKHVTEFYFDNYDREPLIKKLREKGFLRDFEVILKDKHQNIIYALLNSNLILDEDGNIKGAEGVLRDITRRKEVEDQLKLILESINDIIAQVNPQGIITYISPKIEEAYGFKPEELIGNHISKIVSPDDLEKAASIINRVMQGETIKGYEINQKSKSGEIIPMDANITPVYVNGKITAIQAVLRDITARKQIEYLRISNARKFKTLIEQSPVAVEIFNPEGTLIQVNEAWEKLWNVKAEQVIGIHNALKTKPIEDMGLMPLIKKVFAGEKIILPDVCYDPSDAKMPGRARWVRSQGYSTKDENGNIENVILLHEDITERKIAEEALSVSKEKYEILFESAGDAIFVLKNGVFIDINQKACEMFACESDYLLGKTPLDLTPDIPDNNNYTAEKVEYYASEVMKGEPQHFEWMLQKADGSKFPAEITLTMMKLPTGILLLALVRDITERKEFETKIIESEKTFRTVIEQSNDAIYILNNNSIDLVNKKFYELTGYEEDDINHPDFGFIDVVAPEYRELLLERRDMWDRGESPPQVYEYAIQKKNGETRFVQASVSRIDYKNGIAILGILRDIHAQKILEDQLLQIQKIESIGHLAGGIAHDFNNLLTPILGTSELAMLELENSDKFHDKFKDIFDTASRASILTRQLLAFSRKQVLDIKEVKLNNLIRAFSKILRRTIRENVEINIELNENIGLVRVDVSQIEQILMNLFVNAQDAMPDGGKITVKTDSVELDHEYSVNHTGVVIGKYVMISVSDDGEGMDEITRQKLFDPFYTTKEAGKGTGLGLSTVYGIVKQHDGHIWVYSEPGRGTIFKLYFREIQGQAESGSDQKDKKKLLMGDETILIVEDQKEVRNIAAQILMAHGYKVHLADCGEKAISIIREEKLKLDMLLTDVVMPGMNGRELYTEMEKYYDNLKVLFMSGYTQSALSKHELSEGNINFIQKPLTVKELTRKIRDILDS